VIGTAFALQMLFGLPLWVGVLLTGTSSQLCFDTTMKKTFSSLFSFPGLDTMLLLGLQFFGARLFEIFIAGIVGIISICFVVESALSPIEWVHAHCPSHWCDMFVSSHDNSLSTGFDSNQPILANDLLTASANSTDCPTNYWCASNSTQVASGSFWLIFFLIAGPFLAALFHVWTSRACTMQ
jgi:hypothetical protein